MNEYKKVTQKSANECMCMFMCNIYFRAQFPIGRGIISIRVRLPDVESACIVR